MAGKLKTETIAAKRILFLKVKWVLDALCEDLVFFVTRKKYRTTKGTKKYSTKHIKTC